MKEELIKQCAELFKKRDALQETLDSWKGAEVGHDIQVSPLVIGIPSYLLALNAYRFENFLRGEIQALNLELHTLGVELPGVPPIGEAQAVTKGQDQ